MTSRGTKTTPDTPRRHDTTTTMTTTCSSSRCADDANRTPSSHPRPNTRHATPPPRRRSPTPARSLASLAAVVVGVVVAGLAGSVEAWQMDFSAPEVIQYGTCAQPKDQQPFDFRQFSGLWYQVEMVPNSYMEAEQCITLHFDWNGEAYNVTTRGLNEYNEVVFQDAIISKEMPKERSPSRPYLKIKATGVPPVPYHVVKTDYHHFACVYSCFELFALMFEAFSVLSRHPEVDVMTHQACHDAFTALDLDVNRLKLVNHDGLCLEEGLEGSGEGALRWDEEEHQPGNALAELTSEEGNPESACASASNRCSDPALEEDQEEGETLMEEEEEEAQEGKDGGAAAGEEAEGILVDLTKTKLGEPKNQTENGKRKHAGGTSEKSDHEGRKKPRKGHRRKKVKGAHRRGKEGRKEEGEEETQPMTSRDQQFYLDDLHLESLYYPKMEEERVGGGGGRGGRGGEDERDDASFPTHDQLSPHTGAGDVAGSSAPLLLLALLTLVLRARIPPTP